MHSSTTRSYYIILNICHDGALVHDPACCTDGCILKGFTVRLVSDWEIYLIGSLELPCTVVKVESANNPVGVGHIFESGRWNY
jgi:hypothetical protein